jgi:hypothetical protein
MTYEEFEAEMDKMCGRSVTLGPAHDPSGASCELDAGHSGPHRSPSPFGEGVYEWTGGGMCAGDPLPYRGRFTSGSLPDGTVFPPSGPGRHGYNAAGMPVDE